MKVGCEGRPRLGDSVTIGCGGPVTPALTRAELIDRVVCASIAVAEGGHDEMGAVHGARLAVALAFANQLSGVQPPLTSEEVGARAARVGRWRGHLASLLGARGIAQRTPEWYAARHSLITASDAAQALGCAKFGNQRAFFQKKCGLPEEQAPFDAEVPPLKWGVMFEPVAQAIYSAAGGGLRVHEFGLLRHPAPDQAHIGASPDGISDLGVMLEIKCPWRRRIVEGEVPMQYYHQIQAQLAVCGLEECDYFECEFEELRDGPADGRWDEAAAGQPFERGAFVEVAAVGGGKTFLYPEPAAGLAADELAAWVAERRAEAAAQGAQLWEHWWTLRKRATVRVPLDGAFVADMFARLATVWAAVLAYRADRERYLAEVGAATPAAPRAFGARGLPDFEDEDVAEGKDGGGGRTRPPAPSFSTYAFVDDN